MGFRQHGGQAQVFGAGIQHQAAGGGNAPVGQGEGRVQVGGVLPQVIRDQLHPGAPAGVFQGRLVWPSQPKAAMDLPPCFMVRRSGIIEGRGQVHDLGDHHLDGRGLFLKEIQVSLWPINPCLSYVGRLAVAGEAAWVPELLSGKAAAKGHARSCRDRAPAGLIDCLSRV